MTFVYRKGSKESLAMLGLLSRMVEAVNTACYVQNRVLVNKSHNKTPYQLFNGRSPAIGFLKPFGCHVMILNTLDNLGKFEEKGDEGYFIGYSMSSKAFMVFNKRTRRVEENLHVEFLENKAIEKLLALIGIKDATSQEVKKDAYSLRYIALPNWAHDALLESSSSKPQDHCSTEVPEGSGNPNPTASTSNPPADPMEILTVESHIPSVSSPVLTAYSTDSQEPSSDARLISKKVANQEETPSLDNILSLTNRVEDILGVTKNSEESNGVEADISNMETAITASPTLTLRIHKDHPKSQIIGPLDTPIQIRNKSKEVEEQSFIAIIYQKTNPALLQGKTHWDKWVLKNKKDERGIVIRNKARLVAQGHTQEEGIDYDEVFAPVARIEAITLFLAYASFMGTKDATSQEVKKNLSSLRYIALPNWVYDALLESSLNKPQDHCSTEVPESSGNPNPTASTSNPPADPMEILTVESPIPTVSSPVLTAYFTDSQDPSSDARLILKRVANQEETPSLDNILSLTNRFEDILGITTNLEESNGVEADISNMETAITVTPTLRIHKDHPKSQIIGPLDTPIQTRNKSKENVWTLVDCPKGVRPIGTKWVLKNKKDKRGIVIRNKARLVAQGHTQEEGIEYDEIFAPVARIEAIRLFLAYASFMGFTVYQMDVKSAFLYGTIDKEVEFEAFTHEKLEMSAMGDILKKFRYSDVRSSNTPMDKENPWRKYVTRKDVDLHLYRSMIGSLMYLTASRPDIMFAVCACARHQVTPKECHLYAVKWIFRYLKGYPKLGLWYPKESSFDLVAYSDSDYGGATQDRKSTTGECQILGKRLISWQCKKQTIVATSTTEAEYVAAASCYGQVLWIQNQCKLFSLLGKLSTVSDFLDFGLTFA
nr:hypothetical protein [Tanacetum cinerariifolium]